MIARYWYNTTVHTTILGLVGALLAWGASEIPRQWSQTSLDDFLVYSAAAEQNAKAVREGRLTSVQGVEATNRLNHVHTGNPYVKIVNNVGSSAREKSYRVGQLRRQDESKARIGSLAWFGIVGVIMAVFLSAAGPIAARDTRSATLHAAVGALCGLVGAFGVCLFSHDLSRAIPNPGGESAGMAGQILGRSASWAFLGLFLGITPGILLRNGKRLAIGLAAGVAGGLLGGALVDPLCAVTHNGVVSRLIALGVVGVVSGLATGMIENAVKLGWLRVVTGRIAGKQYVLYRSPTCIGSASKCEIRLLKDPQVAPQHTVIRAVDGGYDIVDLHMVTRTLVNGHRFDRRRLVNGDQIQIGSTCLLFLENKAAASGTGSA